MRITLICFFTAVLLIALDISRRINLTDKLPMLFWLLVLPHTAVIVYMLRFQPIIRIIALLLVFSYVFNKILFLPNLRREAESKRLFVMDGGRLQIIYCFYAQIIQIIVYIVLFTKCSFQLNKLFTADLVVTLIVLWLLGASGTLRVLCTSTWLSVIKRIICIIFLQFPITNAIVMLYMIRVSALEYEFFSFKEIRQERRRIMSNLCKTKYPILMVHGVGFRDLRYFNYWGRIPNELEANGAKVFYGNQEGWATTPYNAEILKDSIM
ncbi:MAG: triacylglycerol lipase, partial [Firmicutes bacterium]|nr:triacylglycerol lipase [Bacillota bacterium]